MTDRTQGAGGGATHAVGAKGPDELRQQIEQTRSQLGDTVEELAAKADVKGRAKARAADLRDKAGAMTVQLRSTAAQAGHRVQERTAEAGHRAQEKAQRAGHTAGDSVRRPVSGAVRTCRSHPRQTIAGAVGVMVVVAGIAGLMVRRRRG
ncbi:DUF3618 domain-containing protein [Streptomyces sp. NPDC015220]|uniref:DUF3618 domain-containing protein n=1 Tax=Streptomyces sp. NPDC015220 TaxID=3364947 RepID=UPI0036FDCA0D